MRRNALPTRPLVWALATVLFFVSAPVQGADQYKIDGNHAFVYFNVNHNGWAHAWGRFNTVSGDIAFDKNDPSKSSISVVIDAASVDTNHKKRDDHLRSPDFFNTEEFPEITFESTGIEQTGERTGKVVGNLTLLGVTKEMTLDVTWNVESPLPWDANVVKTGFSTVLKVMPGEFGMTNVPEWGMGPEVTMFLEIEAIKQ
jgi:polyisoprenoid-binding protein YceI